MATATPAKESNKPKESAADRFTRLGNARGNKVLGDLRLVGQLGNGQYEYTAAQVENLFDNIRKAVDAAQAMYFQPTTTRSKEAVKLV